MVWFVGFFSRMKMRRHVRFSDTTGFIVGRTAVENRWKLQVEEEMVAVRALQRPTPPSSVPNCQVRSYLIKLVCLHFRFGRPNPQYLRLENSVGTCTIHFLCYYLCSSSTVAVVVAIPIN
jgi:hypothetical protein